MTMRREIFRGDLEHLQIWALKMASSFQSPHIYLLSGDLGVGKTTFVKAFLEFFKLSKEASSPTYSIINQYEHPRIKIYHVDLYRIENAEDLSSTGFWDLFNEPAVLFVEWPKHLDTVVLQWPVTHLYFHFVDGQEKLRRVER